MTEPQFQIDAHRSSEGTVVRVVGELDITTSPAVRDVLCNLDGMVVVDLDAVTFLDSTAMRVLVDARARLTAAGGDLRVRRPHPHVRRVLEIMELGSLIEPD